MINAVAATRPRSRRTGAAPMSTLSLDFDAPRSAAYDALPPSVRHSQTSRAAAEAIRPETATLRENVLRWLTENGPATDEQMAAAFPNRKDSTTRARRVELTQSGFVCDTGKKAKTVSGRDAVLWGVVRILAGGQS